jgi:hypothetical protein
MFGDGFFLFYLSFVMLIIFSFALPMSMYLIPLPFQLLFCVFMLWRYPYAEPASPWDDVLEEKSWWEKDEEPQEEKPRDEDVLW